MKWWLSYMVVVYRSGVETFGTLWIKCFFKICTNDEVSKIDLDQFSAIYDYFSPEKNLILWVKRFGRPFYNLKSY